MAGVKLAKREIVYIIVIAVLAVSLTFTYFQDIIVSGSQEKAVNNVENVYSMLTESEVEILSVTDAGYLYKILLRLKLPGGDALREVYVTKDGKYFSESGNVMDVSGTMERLSREKDFAECLRAKGFLVFGQKSEPNTVQQLMIIGNYANKVYVDCVGANLQACQQLGIRTIPTIVYNRMNYTGVKTRQWIETLTGCKY